jgi:tryptophan synthase beta chain
MILFNWSGHGLMDLVGYEKYFLGELEDYALPHEDLERFAESMAGFPKPGSA